MAGIPGGIVSTFGMVLPSFVVILIITGIYEKIKDRTVVKGIMGGLKPSVVALVAVALFSMIRTVFLGGFNVVDLTSFLSAFKNPAFLVMAGLCIAMTGLAFVKKIHPVLILAVSAAAGIAAGYLLHL
jgi:chromate transporter